MRVRRCAAGFVNYDRARRFGEIISVGSCKNAYSFQCKPKDRHLCTFLPARLPASTPVHWNVSSPRVLANFRRILRTAKDERPLQSFFKENPIALATGLLRPHAVWVIPWPSLLLPQSGGGIPDFILCEWSSIGPQWIIVELESPRKSPVTRSGVSAICNHAAEQINRYKTYLRDNALFLRDNGWPGIHGECEGVIVIGRRSDPNRSKHWQRLEEFRRQHIEVASYDRLLEIFAETQERIRTRGF